MIRLVLAAALLTFPVAASAQDAQAQTGQPPKRIRSFDLAPGQPCPRSTSDEVVVCHTLENPYRIPKALRDEGPIPAKNQSWVNRTETIEEVNRVAGQVPNSCSAVGNAGQSGCEAQALREWTAEERARRADSAAAQSQAAAENGDITSRGDVTQTAPPAQ